MRAGRLAVLVVSVLVSLLAAAGAVRAATPLPRAESDFVARIAGERSSRGLGSLRVADDLEVVARRHAERMAARGSPYHNPALADEVQGWQVVGENVGKGVDVASLHAAFMASATHADQITFPGYTELGLGVVEADGSLYVVQVFRQPMAASDTAPAPAPPPEEPAPDRQPTAPPPAATPAPVPPVEPAPATPPPVSTPAPPTTPAATTRSGETAEVDPPAALAATGVVGAPEAAAALGAAPTAPRTASLASLDLVPEAAVLPVGSLLEASPGVPAAVGVATGLLALVVGLQGLALRRLGLA